MSSAKHFHFSGICGTAMASLAVLLKTRGHQITGSDQNPYPPMSTFLEDNHIPLAPGYKPEHLQPHPDYVVLGNALSRGNAEVEYALRAHLHYLSMAELLKNEFIRGTCSLVISGTHGKTTTTSLTAHVFTEAGKPTGFMVGGIPLNFNSSVRDVEKGGYFVTEGDEYDTSFFDKRAKLFHYLPDRLIINNLEFDHADIYDNLDQIKQAFTLALRQMPDNGLIIANGDDPHALDVAKKGFCPVVTFGLNPSNDAVVSKINALQGSLGMSFTLTWQGQAMDFTLPLVGEHNVRNAAAVIVLALHEGISLAQVQAAFASFKGVKRRQERVSKNSQVQVYDDFAHHPTAIRETIKALRTAFPQARIHAIYEARSNTSVRRVHQESMSQAFAEADQVTFYKLHRAERLNPADRLDLDQVVQELAAMGKPSRYLDDLAQIQALALAAAAPGDVILVMSQGSFEGLPLTLAQALDQRYGD